jgi:hypothetical protein
VHTHGKFHSSCTVFSLSSSVKANPLPLQSPHPSVLPPDMQEIETPRQCCFRLQKVGMILFPVEYSEHIARMIFPEPVIDDPLSISVREATKLINPPIFAGNLCETQYRLGGKFSRIGSFEPQLTPHISTLSIYLPPPTSYVLSALYHGPTFPLRSHDPRLRAHEQAASIVQSPPTRYRPYEDIKGAGERRERKRRYPGRRTFSGRSPLVRFPVAHSPHQLAQADLFAVPLQVVIRPS